MNITDYTSIILHLIVLIILVIILLYGVSYLFEQIRKTYDKTLWDTRELERIRVARQIVNGAGWFNPDECKLITIVGKNILKNNGSFDPSTARDEWRNSNVHIQEMSKPIVCSQCTTVFNADLEKCPECGHTEI